MRGGAAKRSSDATKGTEGRTATHADFAELIEAAAVKGIGDLFGESAGRALIFHLNLQSFEDVKAFDSKLSGFLGSGATVLERSIMHELFNILGASDQSWDGDFASSVAKAKKLYEETLEVRTD